MGSATLSQALNACGSPMTDVLTFQPNDQGEIAVAAGELYYSIETKLPRVPWLSNSGATECLSRNC